MEEEVCKGLSAPEGHNAAVGKMLPHKSPCLPALCHRTRKERRWPKRKSKGHAATRHPGSGVVSEVPVVSERK